MTPQDREFARRAIQEGRLTVAQVTVLKDEVGRTGRPLADLARERGWLAPPAVTLESLAKKLPIFDIVQAASAALILVLLTLTVWWIVGRSRRDEQRDEDSLRRVMEAERLNQQVRHDYGLKVVEQREKGAQEALAKARTSMKAAEEKAVSAPDDPELYIRLVEASLGFNAYLDVHPEDAPVLTERARAWELRGIAERAIADLERACSLRPDLEPALRTRIETLRPRPPK